MNVQAVVVIYKEKLEQTEFYSSYLKLNNNNARFLIYDNSPEPQTIPVDLSFDYFHDPENSGLTKAYNKALQLAQSNDCEWLWLLDQDSKFMPEFLDNLKCEELNPEVVSTVPHVYSHGKLISPVKVKYGCAFPNQHIETCGVHDKPLMALNSGSLIRSSFLKEINGFSTNYKLDYVDHWFFREVYKNGKKVHVNSNKLNHNLSIMDFEKNVSYERYSSIMDAEELFYKSSKSTLTKLIYLFFLFRRSIGFYLKFSDKKFAKITLKKVFGR